MIRRIQLRNFQSHARTDLQLDEGINAIVGPSDSGKSAILRALYWVVDNRPTGTAFVSSWALGEKGEQIGDTFVRIIADKGSVRRIRNRVLNGYKVRLGTSPVQNLEAIRTEVPEVVSRFFNLSEVNFQKQLDAPFLLSASAGEVARFFNSIIKLDEIDSALSLADRKRRETKREIERAEVEAAEAEKALERFGFLDTAWAAVSRADQLERRLTARRENLDEIDSAIESWDETEEEFSRWETIEEQAGPTIEAAEAVEEYRRIVKRVTAIAKVLAEIEDAREEVEIDRGAIDSEMAVAKAAAIGTDLDRIASEIDDIDSILVGSEEASEDIAGAERTIETLRSKLPETCPICGSPMGPRHEEEKR